MSKTEYKHPTNRNSTPDGEYYLSPSYLYQDDRKEFTSCCGSCSKGCDGYLGCRCCYQEIEEHYRHGEEKQFRDTIDNKILRAKFDQLISTPRDLYSKEFKEELNNLFGDNHLLTVNLKENKHE